MNPERLILAQGPEGLQQRPNLAVRGCCRRS
jgi:hypothetical protein